MSERYETDQRLPHTVRFIHITDPYSDHGSALDAAGMVGVAGIESPLGVGGGTIPIPHDSRLWPPMENTIRSPSFGLDTLSSVATSDPFHLGMTPITTPGRNYTQLTASPTYHTPPESRPNTGHNSVPVTRSNNASRGATSTPSTATTPIDLSLQTPSRSVDSSQITSAPSLSTSVEDEHEIAFLMRHYAEVPGYG